MGHICYGTDPANPLDAALRKHGLGAAGSRTPLGDLPDLLAEIMPLWWEHHGATYGSLDLEGGGISGGVTTPLIKGEKVHTAMAAAGIRALCDLFAADGCRTKAFGPGHESALALTWDLRAYRFEEPSAAQCADGTYPVIPEGTVVSRLFLTEVPVYSAPQYFRLHGSEDRKTRMSTRDYFEQNEAVSRSWYATYQSAVSG